MCVEVRRQLLGANPLLLQRVLGIGGKQLYLLNHRASSVGWLCLR